MGRDAAGSDMVGSSGSNVRLNYEQSVEDEDGGEGEAKIEVPLEASSSPGRHSRPLSASGRESAVHRRADTSKTSLSVDDSEEDVGFNDWDSTGDRNATRSRCCPTRVRRCLSMFGLLGPIMLGTLPLVAGIMLRLQFEEFTLPILVLCFVGFSLTGRFLCVIFIGLLLSLIASVEWCLPKRKFGISVISYYLRGISSPMSGLLWVGYTLGGSFLISYFTRDDPTLEWEAAEYYIRNIFKFVSLYYLARVVTSVLSMYLSQDFGIRAYRERLRETMYNEYILNALLGTSNRIFKTIYRSPIILSDIDSVHPRIWQRVIQYVNIAHVDGNPAKSDHHTPPKPGSESNLSSLAHPVARQIFERLYRLVEGDNYRNMSVNETIAEAAEDEISDEEHNREEKLSNGAAKPRTTMTRRKAKKRVYQRNAFAALDAINFPKDIDRERFWATLDVKGTGYTTMSRLARAIEGMFSDRYSLSLTLQDSQDVIKAMDTMIFSICSVVMTLIAVSIFSRDNVQLVASLVSAILAWSFVFGKSVATSFNNLVYLLAEHPYDVGDKIELDKERYEVLRIHLFSTDLLRSDGAFFRADNAHLSESKTLYNLTTSRNLGVPLQFYVPVHLMTPDLNKQIQDELDVFVKEHTRSVEMLWVSAREIVHPLMPGINGHCGDMRNSTHVRFTIWVKYNFNFTNPVQVFNQQTDVIAHVCQTLKHLEVLG